MSRMLLYLDTVYSLMFEFMV